MRREALRWIGHTVPDPTALAPAAPLILRASRYSVAWRGGGGAAHYRVQTRAKIHRYSGHSDAVVTVVQWSQWCSGHSGAVVTVVQWSQWCSGHSGAMVTLVQWSHWCSGLSDTVVTLIQ
eukprot:1177504-Prorocentrum_minimum.AAC.2